MFNNVYVIYWLIIKFFLLDFKLNFFIIFLVDNNNYKKGKYFEILNKNK